jgi:hypothetical protein
MQLEVLLVRRICENNCKQQTLLTPHFLKLTARKKYFQKTPPPHHPVKIKIEKVSPTTNIQVVKRASYEQVLLPADLKTEKDEETRQFLEHVAAQNAPDPWDCIRENESITSPLSASQDGAINLLAEDHAKTKLTTIVAPVSEEVGSMSKDPDPGYLDKDPGPQLDVVCPHCLESPCQWLRFGSSVRDYFQDRLDTIGPENMPPNNIVRKQLYRQMAMMLGFIRREEHAWCVQTGIRVIAPSDEYMGHRWA